MKKNLLPISILVLAVAIIISGVLITSSIRECNKDILTYDEARAYLNLTEQEFKYIIDNSFANIPYLKVNDKYLFSKKGICNGVEEWPPFSFETETTTKNKN